MEFSVVGEFPEVDLGGLCKMLALAKLDTTTLYKDLTDRGLQSPRACFRFINDDTAPHEGYDNWWLEKKVNLKPEEIVRFQNVLQAVVMAGSLPQFSELADRAGAQDKITIQLLRTTLKHVKDAREASERLYALSGIEDTTPYGFLERCIEEALSWLEAEGDW